MKKFDKLIFVKIENTHGDISLELNSNNISLEDSWTSASPNMYVGLNQNDMIQNRSYNLPFSVNAIKEFELISTTNNETSISLISNNKVISISTSSANTNMLLKITFN